MIVEFPYHKSIVKIEALPAEQTVVLTSKDSDHMPDVSAELHRAVENPTGSLPLNRIINPTDSVGILVPDHTREALIPVVLPFLIRYIRDAGHSPEGIHVFIGKGTHRPMTDAELISMVGEHIFDSIPILQPDPDNSRDYVMLGYTSRQTPVQYYQPFLEMDRIILTGAVNFHYFAGFGGGKKIQAVCMCSRETIKANHKLSLSGRDGGFHPRVEPGVMDGNPVHEDMMEITGYRDPDFLINVVLNDAGNLMKCFAGHYRDAHESACAYFLENRSRPVDEPADLVIAGCGGYPFDLNFIQAHKTLESAGRAVKQGGTIAFIAACADGIGGTGFLEWFEHESLADFKQALSRNYRLNGHTALATFIKTRRFNVMMHSELSEDTLNKMNIEKIYDPRITVRECISRLPGNSRIIAIPNGHALLPIPKRNRLTSR